MAKDPYQGSEMEKVASPGVRVGTPKVVSAGRVMSFKGPKIPVARGSLGPRNSAPIVNGD